MRSWTLVLAVSLLVACKPAPEKLDDHAPVASTDDAVAERPLVVPPFDQITGAPPGALPYDDTLRAELARAVAERAAAGQTPRTRHLRDSALPAFTNRLALENSPYLQQHAHNPVDWFPWGDEAFARARELDRPIFLSVGYSTCHWCHVMEEESFEDLEIARLLNERFVAIKVDREQRPDVDDLYMRAVAMLGGGRTGWPMTVVMTPEREPFFGATYIPPRAGVRRAQQGLLEILALLDDAYRDDRDAVVAHAAEVTGRIQDAIRPAPPADVPGAEALLATARAYEAAFDDRYGGLRSTSSKFPRADVLRLLLRVFRRTGEARYLEMVDETLEAMARGGLYDHVGGGFHRYSVDPAWRVPHFEKMLYDNAQLVTAYLEGYQATGREAYAHVVRDVLGWLEREMTSPRGGFYSALDADSEGEEGRFYVWSLDQMRDVLGEDGLRTARRVWDVTEAGNFEGARNVLTARVSLDELDAQRDSLAPIRERLLAAREQRPRPLRDDKILASWNGLTIGALARASVVLGEPIYLVRAERAAGFLLESLWHEGRLYRVWLDGRGDVLGYLDDYAMVIDGLLDLYEASGEPRWLSEALAMHSVVEAHFSDADGGGAYFMSSDEHEALLAREKPVRDGAIPSGNAVMAHNLLRLAELTGDEAYHARALSILGALGQTLAERGTQAPWLSAALDFELDTPRQVVLVAAPSGSFGALPSALGEIFLPNRVVVRVPSMAARERLKALVPLVSDKVPREGKATAYVCEAGRCERPAVDAGTLRRQLSQVVPYEKSLLAAPGEPEGHEH